MTTEEGTPSAEAPAEQSSAEAPDKDDISKNLLMQVGIVGGIVLLVLLAVFFGVI